MDEKKVTAVQECPLPQTLKQLQRFLGFTNFYRRFIRNFSTLAAPLTSMTRRNHVKLAWQPEAIKAFTVLKEKFTSAPVLHHPNPELPFVVEVDVFNTGVGTVFSQLQGIPEKIYP